MESSPHFFDWVQILFFIGLFVCLTPILGKYMANLFTEKKSFLHPIFGWLERLCYWAGGIDPTVEMTWVQYVKSLVIFNFLGFLCLFILQLIQQYLPLNPQKFPATSWDLAFNTAMSFATNTNWQSYAGETTLSYLTQMLGLTVQNFMSAAIGMAALVALIRGITRKSMDTIGNFWQDLVRFTVYVLLPLSIIMAIVLVVEGSVQTFSPYEEVTTLENGKQTIPLGPVASQISIKQLGTNGGGFFNANSAHPFENPTALTNILELLAIILIPAASVYMYGLMIHSRRHAVLIYFAMFVIWAGGLALSFYSEYKLNPILGVFPNLEGIETRHGITNTLLWSVSTTAIANGSVNAMMSSLNPIAGGIAMFNIMLGEIIFGGVGVGLLGMLMHILLTVFLVGLMVGRTPEYLGKKIEKREIQWVTMAVLLPGALILIGSGLFCVYPDALSSLGNKGPHGLSEILYAYTSCSGNNGSAFAGLNANTTTYNLALGFVMLFARTSIVLPSIAIAGLLARKKITPPSVGTFSTNSLLFLILLTGVFLIVAGLTFFPALSLGPIVEHLLMLQNRTF